MTNIVLPPVTNGNNISTLNDNFRKIQESVNNDLLNLDGGNNVMQQDLDMNGNQLLNIGVDVNNPGSLLTVAAGDSRYYNVSGDTLTGPMSVNGQTISGLAAAIASTSPVRKAEFDAALFDSATELAANLANSTDPTKGSNLVGHNDGGPGSVGVNLHQVALESTSVIRSGAIGNYTIGGSGFDSTQAFQKAFDNATLNGNRSLRVPGGTYLITAPVVGEPLMLIGEPGATTIVFKNMAAMKCFPFLPATKIGRILGSYGIEYVVEGANVDCVFEGPKDSSQYFTYFLRYHFELNYFHGANRVPATYSFGWDYSATKWLRVSDSTGSHIFHNNFQGSWDIITDPSGQFQDSAVEFDAAGAVLSARMHNNNMGPIYRASTIKDRVFLTAHDNDIIGAMDGFIWDGGTLFNEPKVFHNNFNVQRDGIKATGIDSVHFTDNTVRRHRLGFKGSTHDWNAFNFNSCADLKLTDNTAQPDESSGPFSGYMTAYNLTSCGGTLAGNTVGVGNDSGFILDNCSGFTLDGTKSDQNSATDILFDLRNNTRGLTIGTFATVSTFSGQPLKKTGITAAIQMINNLFDLQSSGNVTLDMTRVSSALDEKRARLIKAATTLSLQFVNDAGTSQNALIFTQSGSTPVSADVRGTELITPNVRPRVTLNSALGSATFQYNDLFSARGTFSGPVQLGKYTLTTLPSAATFNGFMIDVTNATGGPKTCRSNGTVWQILNTTTTVS